MRSGQAVLERQRLNLGWLVLAPTLWAVTLPVLAEPATVPSIQIAGMGDRDIADLSLSELMSIEVTSVSRRAQPLREAAAAIFVVTGEEMRRAGVRTLADALRLVPGLQVRSTSAQGYSVTSRGFSADKLEVLLDGRSVYSPLTSTVFWDTLGTYLPDVERIEVIRGPGATLWGANAMNGVINIVTRDARSTTGTQVLGGGGNEERAFVGIRTGEALGEDGAIRFYATARERDQSATANGEDQWDGIGKQRAGFRYDGALDSSTAMLVSGDVFHSRSRVRGILADGSMPREHSESRGGYLQGQWTTQTDSGSAWSIDGSYTGYEISFPTVFQERRHTAELGLRNNIPVGRHNLVWGAGGRVSRDETGGQPLLLFFDPQDRILDKYNLYAQDQIRLGDGGELTLGSKFEYNTITGFEVQPGVRLGWMLTPQLFTWGAVSRAVRTPNRLDSDVLIFCSFASLTNPPCDPGTSTRLGNPELESEKLIAYEVGVRTWTKTFSAELDVFFNDYTDLRSTEAGSAPFGPFANNLEGQSYGGELTLGWTPLYWLNLHAFYGLVKIDVEPRPGSNDQRSEATIEGGTPQQSAGVRLSVQPLDPLSVDAFVRYVDRLPAVKVPQYTEMNLRVGWQFRPELGLALVGENLLDARHAESATTTEAQRSVFLELLWTLN